MAPLVRRSWSVRGQPPRMKQKVGHREKGSVAGGLWLTPLRNRLGLSFETIVNGYFNNEAVAGFVGDVLEELNGPAIVIWDGGSMHKGDPIHELVAQYPKGLAWERLPAHAPELMPM